MVFDYILSSLEEWFNDTGYNYVFQKIFFAFNIVFFEDI